MRALLRVRTPTQSEVQGENLDQLPSWQSSRHGNWQSWLITGMLLANFRHWTTSATVPSSCLHEIAVDHTHKHSAETPADYTENQTPERRAAGEQKMRIYRHDKPERKRESHAVSLWSETSLNYALHFCSFYIIQWFFPVVLDYYNIKKERFFGSCSV